MAFYSICFFFLIDHLRFSSVFALFFYFFYFFFFFFFYGLTYAISTYSKFDLWKNILEIILLVFIDFLIFHNNILKIPEILNKLNSLKACIQTTV